MTHAEEALVTRGRDPLQEERERLRYRVLKGIYDLGSLARVRPVRALEIGLALGISREELFRTVLDLTHRSYLRFCAAGPQVQITNDGVAYIEGGARRRRSVRNT